MATGKSTTDHVISAANKQDCAMHRVAFGDEICKSYSSDAYRPNTDYSSQFPGDHDEPRIADGATENWGGELDTNIGEVPVIEDEKPKLDPLLVSSLASPTRVRPTVTMDLSESSSTSPIPTLEASPQTWERPGSPVAVETAELPPLPESRPSAASVIDGDAGRRFLSLGSFRTADRAERLVDRFAALKPSIMTVNVGGLTWQRVTVGPMSKAAANRLRRAHARIDGRDTWTFTK
ncbi:MAG: SPOR domain-containing protein [Alphaproteobacteria bacterium]|nr:SPOR domain-containing protein [Alphaproteobacteria bacterium]